MRWLCDLIGYGSHSFGLLTSGGVMANFMGMTLARDIHLGRLLGAGRAPRGRHARRRPGLHLGPDPLLHRARPRPPGLPAGDARRHPVRRAVPAPRRARRRGGRPRPRRRSPAVRDRGGRRLHQHGLGRPRRRAGRCRRGGGPVAPRRRGVRRRRAAVGARSRPGARPRARGFGHRRPAQVVLPGLRHRRPAGPRRGAPWPGVRWAGARVLPRRRDARAGPRDAADHDDHGDQLNFYKLSFEGTRRWRALKLWMSWKHLGTDGFGRLVEANDDLAALLARRCAESDDFEAIPATPELSVVCFRHLPGGRDAAMAMAPEALDAHQDRLQAALEASGDGWLTTTRLRRCDLAARRDRQLPVDRGRHRRTPRDAAAPRRGRPSRRRRARASRPRSPAVGSRPHRHGPASSAGSPRHPPVRRRWRARAPRAAPRRRPG